MRSADPGDEGICLARLAAHVHSKNRGVADAKASGEPSQARFERSRQRLELVEERHHVERHDDVTRDEERKRAEARKPRPAPRCATHRRTEERCEKRAQGGAQQGTLGIFAQPIAPILLAQTEAPFERVLRYERGGEVGDRRGQRERGEEERGSQPDRRGHRRAIERTSERAVREGEKSDRRARRFGDLKLSPNSGIGRSVLLQQR